jgi:VanZ family protein
MAGPIPQKRTRSKFAWFWLPALLYIGLIFFLSSQPRLRSPFRFRNGDKVSHVLEYGGLGFLLGRAWRVTLPGSVWRFTGLALASGIVVAICDEYWQSFVPGRESSAYDAMADALGLTLAQIVLARRTR